MTFSKNQSSKIHSTKSSTHRKDGRQPQDMRPVKMTIDVNNYAEGSCLVEFGNTKVLCTASLESGVPKWLQGTGRGWVTAEYGMLPRSTHTRMRREKIAEGGRTQEISRLIGRSLRSVVQLEKLGERSFVVDCDVMQADGGTRTASVTGGFVALALAIGKLREAGVIPLQPLKDSVSAISVGLSPSGAWLDLDYEEDSSIDTDMNFVLTGQGQFVEVQGTAEKTPFNTESLMALVGFAQQGCAELKKVQQETLGAFFPQL